MAYWNNKDKSSTDQTPQDTPPPAPKRIPLDIFQNESYYNDPALKRIVDSYVGYASGHPVDVNGDAFRNAVYGQISGYANSFISQFRDKVGRDPNAEEMGKFLSFLDTQSPATQNAQIFGEQIGQKTTGFIGSNFQRTAQEEAQKKLEEQSIAAVAPNSAFDVWQNSYKNSLNDVEQSLQDYQSKLFEKIRPNLITSLQAQGLLNSGALNEAFAGQAKDLADANSSYLASAKGAINQDIANQKYALQSAPTTYQIQNTIGGPERLYSGGQQALQNVWQASMANLEAQNQRNLLDYQNSIAPRSNPLNQYAGLILGGVAGGLPGAFASYAGQRYAADKQYGR